MNNQDGFNIESSMPVWALIEKVKAEFEKDENAKTMAIKANGIVIRFSRDENKDGDVK